MWNVHKLIAVSTNSFKVKEITVDSPTKESKEEEERESEEEKVEHVEKQPYVNLEEIVDGSDSDDK